MSEFKVGDLTVKPQLNLEWRSIHPAIGIVDDIAYVGVWVPSEIVGKAGLSSVKRLLYLVTSDREMVLANEDVFRQRKWMIEYKPIEFQNRWSLKHVKAYLDGASANPCETLERLIEAYRLYVELPCEAEYIYHALWDIGTYFHHLFNAYPYIYVGGVKRSGKTKLLTVHYCLAFNAFFSNNMSTSSIYRLTQNAHGTLLIDETEKLSQPDRALEFRSILLAGYKKGQKVYRCEKPRRETIQPEAFDVYAPKGLANIQGLEDVLEDRCKVTILRRSRNRGILNREIDVEAELWSGLRNGLYMLYLNHWKEVKQIYDEIGELSERSELVNFLETQANERLRDGDLDLISSRMLEIWKPIFALACFFDSKGFAHATFTNSLSSLRSLMVQLCIENAKARIAEDMTETGETLLTQVLFEHVKEDGFYKVKTIREGMANLFDEEQKWLTTRWVANALKRLGFTEKRRVGTGYEYKLRKQDVQDLALRMGVEEKPNESLKDILLKAKDWIVENRDENGLIDLFNLTEFLSGLTDQPARIVDFLKGEGQLFNVGIVGKLGVK
ncbi:MAG: hypothetical protein K6T73_09660 [Candidatus Bathyarchaeota archaeon]|nr:hypothetical protein [Candidatus Bathyarchaeota archaeon]